MSNLNTLINGFDALSGAAFGGGSRRSSKPSKSRNNNSSAKRGAPPKPKVSWGNYCGPGWTSGKKNGSFDKRVPATSKSDAVCKTHDKAIELAQSKGVNACDKRKAIQKADQDAIKGFHKVAKGSNSRTDSTLAGGAQVAFSLKSHYNNAMVTISCP